MKAARRCSESNARQELKSKGESGLIGIFRRRIIKAIRHASLASFILDMLIPVRCNRLLLGSLAIISALYSG